MYGIQEAEGQANNKISIASPAVKATLLEISKEQFSSNTRVELNDILLFLSSCQNINQHVSVIA